MAPRIDGHFDARFDVAWSRNPLAPRNLLGTSGRVRDIVVAGGYDIVHVHTPIAAFVTRYALRHLRKRPGGPAVIYTCHGFHFYRGQPAAPHAFFRTMERTAARWTDYLVTVNHEDFSAAREFSGIAPDHVRYIPGIGVDTKQFAPDAEPASTLEATRAGLDVTPEHFLLTMVAELTANKRHELAFRALAAVRDPRVVLALVGDGALESALREKAVALGISERVRWAGYRRDLPAVLAASDTLLLTSEREGLNRSCLEAMASGVPVIGTDTRGITDTIGRDETCGWIVGHDDAPALAAAIEAAAADPARLAHRGAAARERAVNEFALPRIIASYDGLYGEALASRL